ncbi:MAG: SAM-dependent methyltransferase [Marinoscillum sp.]
MKSFDKSYWDKRYDQLLTGWDTGGITAPLKEYINQLTNKEISILIPGAGNAYEGQYLYDLGFKNLHILDISDRAIKLASKMIPDLPGKCFFVSDFFGHHGQYDLVVEQTFFCALDRGLRMLYRDKMLELLNNGGRLVGLLWAHEIEGDSPPFGGTIDEYRDLFGEYFEIKKMELAYNSIIPRSGRELFINLQKK